MDGLKTPAAEVAQALQLPLADGRHRYHHRSPAMALGLTDHRWLFLERSFLEMRVVRKEDISNPVKNPSGEEIYEMIGRLPKPLEPHQIYNEGEDDLEFLTVSAPAWTADDSFFTPEETHI